MAISTENYYYAVPTYRTCVYTMDKNVEINNRNSYTIYNFVIVYFFQF